MAQLTNEIFILTVDHRVEKDRSTIVLYGISNNGPVEITSNFNPYFYVTSDTSTAVILKLIPESTTVGEEILQSLSGSTVRKLIFLSVPDAEAAGVSLRAQRIQIFESDVKPRERFLMDSRINGSVVATGENKQNAGILKLNNPTLYPSRFVPAFRVCSLDIETAMSSGEILSIAAHLTGNGADERIVFMRGQENMNSPAYLRMVTDERTLLKSFESWFQKADPDLIIGWNVIGFDLSVMQRRAAALQTSLHLSRGNKTFYISENTGRFSRAYISGRVVLDGPQLLRSSFYSFESYSLENVSQGVLGEGKLIHSSSRGWEIERLFKEDKTALAEYNLQDTVLVTRIFEKLGLIDLTVKRSQLSGMLLDQVGLSVASFDHFYLPRLHEQGYVAADVGQITSAYVSAGGYVMSPVAGMYNDIVSLDFQSLYPSIIRTFQIDPLSRAAADSDALVTPKGLKFSRTKSILPAFIGELMAERTVAKIQKDKSLSQAIKILMNSFYGVMGAPGSRLFHPELPDAITSTGQWILIESKRWLENLGHIVIYGDTDSLFVQLGTDKNAKVDSEVLVNGTVIATQLTEYWKQRLKQEYAVDSYLILDFKKQYQKFLVPQTRSSEAGAKKRYAGYSIENGNEDIEFVGFEVVRSDWTKLAKDFQRELYTKVFRGDTVDNWIRDFVERFERGDFNEKLVYRKRLHKPLDEYGKSPPPYVRAARQMAKPSRDVRYIFTKAGPVPIEQSPTDIDFKHYIDRQLRPVADSILEILGTSFEKILSRQMSLF